MTDMADSIMTVSAARTPVGRFGGALVMLTGHELGAAAFRGGGTTRNNTLR